MTRRVAVWRAMRARGAGLCLVALALFGASVMDARPARALDVTEYRVDGRCQAVLLSGDILRQEAVGAIQRIINAAERCGARTIVLGRMPGGSVIDALDIGATIRSRDYVTAMLPDSVCASACGLIFIAGTQRFWRSGGRFVIHRPEIRKVFETPTDELREYEDLRGRLSAYVSAMGANPDYVDAMYAVHPGGSEQLSERDLTRLGLVTAVGSPFTGR